jgi:Leishmanolysin
MPNYVGVSPHQHYLERRIGDNLNQSIRSRQHHREPNGFGGTMKKLVTAFGVLGLLAACNSPSGVNLGQNGPDVPDAPAAALPVYASLKTVPVSTQATEPYNVTLVIVGNPSSSVQGVLNDAAARWQQVVTTGLPDVSGTINAGDCGNPNTFSGTIDDVVIFAGVTDIDGPGGVLAQAGVCYTRTSGGLPVAGLLQFDTADVNSFATADLRNIALHEMGHELGIGTIWRSKGLLRGSSTSNPTFTGANANSAWVSSGGTGRTPVENTGGSGTRNGHWRDSVLKNEILTGYYSAGFNPLSRITVGSLQDVGYTVNYNAADAFNLSTLSTTSVESRAFEHTVLEPKGQVR